MADSLFITGLALILFGFALIFLAIVLSFSHSIKESGKTKGGGAIIIGPFPIILGTDKESIKTLLILSILLTALVLAVLAFFYVVSR